MKASAIMLMVVVAATIMVAMVSAQSTIKATIYYAGPDLPFNIKKDVIDKTQGTAWIQLDATRYQVGWDKLQIGTSNTQPEVFQSWAAGYLEGILTAESIWNVYQNFQFRMLKNQPPAKELVLFINNQIGWTRSMISQYSRSDPYWAQIANLIAQMDGMVAGYQDSTWAATHPLHTIEFLLFQASGDLYDIIPAVVPHERINWSKLEPEQFNELHFELSSCSALHRYTPDGKEIWVGHNTWTDYGSMVRTYKIYDFAFNVPSRRMAFSAKPALLYSKDDFHVLDSGMTVIETTNGIRDESLYANIKPSTLLTWQRIPICNRLSLSGKQWTECFDKYFSGTYANQYQVLDYKMFSPGVPLQPGTLWINEQVPGYTRSEDVTGVLLRNGGYWPSYNVPYNGFIYNISGFWTAYQKYGDQYSYLKCPRAQIFARDYVKVVDRATMQFMMQYNNYKNDPLSLNDPNNAICARSDLKPGGAAFGAIDGKITSRADAFASGSLRAYAISGPTQQQGVFEWTDRYANITHLGEPDVWNFTWQTYDYTL